MAIVRSTAERLEGELLRTAPRASATADFEIAGRAVDQARRLADRPSLTIDGRRFTFIRRTWRRLAAWWTGYEVDQAWAALHTASQALLGIESKKVVKSQLGDMAAQVVTAFDSGDVRVKDYLKTLELLAPARVRITAADRAQLRAIRQACDTSADGGHTDARAFRNTLILVGSLLAAVLVALAVIAALDVSFRTVFSAGGVPGHWFVAELEMMASLSGLTGAVLSLRSYSGFQATYGLPLVQAFLKGTAGAATGLLGVLLTQSGIVTSLKPEPGARVFAVAVVFGYGQYLFTRWLTSKPKPCSPQLARATTLAPPPMFPPGMPRHPCSRPGIQIHSGDPSGGQCAAGLCRPCRGRPQRSVRGWRQQPQIVGGQLASGDQQQRKLLQRPRARAAQGRRRAASSPAPWTGTRALACRTQATRR